MGAVHVALDVRHVGVGQVQATVPVDDVEVRVETDLGMAGQGGAAAAEVTRQDGLPVLGPANVPVPADVGPEVALHVVLEGADPRARIPFRPARQVPDTGTVVPFRHPLGLHEGPPRLRVDGAHAVVLPVGVPARGNPIEAGRGGRPPTTLVAGEGLVPPAAHVDELGHEAVGLAFGVVVATTLAGVRDAGVT